ncbi:hypothetical protein PIB30_070566 [Stylosanthes scabra]|uniref:Uncharacterized protein n=1 Tax=Stylosanthes scabra TaxID=79078 RepID=A0ABU6SPL3_9FABA|nr:hypothetical protein [Stylosanthes scabra]
MKALSKALGRNGTSSGKYILRAIRDIYWIGQGKDKLWMRIIDYPRTKKGLED